MRTNIVIDDKLMRDTLAGHRPEDEARCGGAGIAHAVALATAGADQAFPRQTGLAGRPRRDAARPGTWPTASAKIDYFRGMIQAGNQPAGLADREASRWRRTASFSPRCCRASPATAINRARRWFAPVRDRRSGRDGYRRSSGKELPGAAREGRYRQHDHRYDHGHALHRARTAAALRTTRAFRFVRRLERVHGAAAVRKAY